MEPINYIILGTTTTHSRNQYPLALSEYYDQARTILIINAIMVCSYPKKKN